MRAARPTAGPAKRGTGFRYRDSLTAYLMLLPAFLLMTVFVMIPILMAFYRSFFTFNAYTEPVFAGFNNFKLLLSNDLFLRSMGNVLILTAVILTLMLVLSFTLASAFTTVSRWLSSAAKIIVYLPYMISGIVASIVFIFMIHPGGGLFASLRYSAGLDPIVFTQDGLWPYLCVIFPTLWLGLGYYTLVMFAGLMNIPREYYEAASIDGASRWRKLVSITIPNLKNIFVLLLVVLISGNMQMFEIPMMITGGGPDNKTLTPVLYIFSKYRDPNTLQSVTIAGAMLIMIPIALINSIVFRIVRSEKSQDA